MADGSPARLPRAYLRVGLLIVLSDGPGHGYDLLEHVRELGINASDPGGLYRMLRSMEREGLLESWWEASDTGPARRTYSLTPAGRRALQNDAASLRTTISLLDDLASAAEQRVRDDAVGSRR